jgi:tRNA-dihydrouridine synthase B
MAQLACLSVDEGADIIDINMGCPARRVCRRLAGSALLSDEALVQRILEAVVRAVSVPVTLKMRTGPAPRHRNAVRVASIAEQSGVAAVSVHGRTRQCGYDRPAEYYTVRAVKAAVSIPVIANGDIASPQKARRVLAATGADAVMIGRAAWGNPWIFRDVDHLLRIGAYPQRPTLRAIGDTVLAHLHEVYRLYGERTGVRIARKHLSWYCRGQTGGDRFWRDVSRVETSVQQVKLTSVYYDWLAASAA